MSTGFTPSKYQSAVFDFVRAGQGSAAVIAVAGSGKTTTVIEALKYVPEGQTAQMFAFNTAIAASLRARLPLNPNVGAATFHSTGYQSLRRHWGLRSLDTNANKLMQLSRGMLSGNDKYRYGSFITKLVSLAKGHGVGALTPDTFQVWADLVAHHDLALDEGEEERGIELARDLLKVSTESAEEDFLIDFDDQLYLPVLWNTPVTIRDWVFIDEAQDTNPVRRRLATMSLSDTGRLVAVGDPKQAIYGFTGASHDAISQITEQWDAQELPLSICYRCGIAIVEYAQKLVPQIEPSPDAGPGLVETITMRAALQTLGPADAILCRNNAPLVSLAYRCLADGVPCQILGRDLGKNLQALVDKMRASDLDSLCLKLEEFRRREVRKYQEKDQPGKAASVNDRVDCIQTIIEHLPEDERTLRGLADALDRLFGENITNRLTLSTVHKAKGQEWPRVGILRPDLMPARWAHGWQLDQEYNLQYVAWTRAQQALYFIEE